MADAPAFNSSTAKLLDRIRDEVRKGLPNEKSHRLDDAAKNRDYFELRFWQHEQSWRILRDCRRESPVMQRVVRVLTQHLYRTGPARKFADSEAATEWLDAVYRAAAMPAKWRAADRLACVGEAAAFEVRGSTGPDSLKSEVTIHLWGADQFACWFGPDDPLHPIAVATLEKLDETRRIRLWTAEQLEVFVTDKLRPGQTAGGTEFRPQSAAPNPYGAIPFAFAHFEYPTCEFWSGGPGHNLRQLNASVNYNLADLNECKRKTRPLGTISGAPMDWNFPQDMRPGEWTTIPGVASAGESLTEGTAEYVVCDLAFLQSDWDDLNSYLDHTLEMHGIPKSAVRMEQGSANSGVQVLTEQIPLLDWAEGRQEDWGHYEADLARLVLLVGSTHLARNGLDMGVAAPVPVAELTALIDAGPPTLKWPDLKAGIIDPARDQRDQWRLDNRLASRTIVLMERERLDRDEAEAKLDEIAADLEREATLFKPVDDLGLNAKGQMTVDQQNQQMQAAQGETPSPAAETAATGE